MKTDLWSDVQKARAEIDAAIEQLRPLLKTLPHGRENLAVATAIAHACGAGVALSFREPAVPFQLVFASPPEAEQITEANKGGMK